MSLVVAALSARLLAEAAAGDGHEVLTLDVFGDADTRRCSAQWHSIGKTAPLSIDAALFIAALQRCKDDGATGWVAGSGFESEPELLSRGACVLPLIGTSPRAVRRVREPRVFFGALERHAIAHPPTLDSLPQASEGWLCKSSHGSGGWHIRRAPASSSDSGRYWQRDLPGKPMSALFVANRRSFALLGFNRLIVRPIGASPYVYCGAIGPLALAPGPERELLATIAKLVVEFELCGLASLDFLLQGDSALVLEVNPRPSASMALYPRGTMRAHLQACLHGELRPLRAPLACVRGTEIVYAPAPLELSVEALSRLAADPHRHDLPFAAARIARHAPLCSVSACAGDAAAVGTMLAARRDAALLTLEMP